MTWIVLILWLSASLLSSAVASTISTPHLAVPILVDEAAAAAGATVAAAGAAAGATVAAAGATVAAAPDMLRHNPPRRKMKHKPRTPRGGASRKLQDVNNNKNNKNDLTPSTTPSTSPSPSVSPKPSTSPKPTVTSYPTQSLDPTHLLPITTTNPTTITTTTPTKVPSLKPTVQPISIPQTSAVPIVGILKVSFSLLAKGVTQESVLLGTSDDLVSQIEHAMMLFLCLDTDFILLHDTNATTSTTSSSYCSTTTTRKQRQRQRQRRTQGIDYNNDVSFSTLRPDKMLISVQDRSNQEYNFTYWTFEYPVLSIGTKYIEMAKENTGTTGLTNMQHVAQLAVDLHITDGTFDELLNQHHINNNNDDDDASRSLTYQTAIVGQEIQMWSAPANGYYLPLDPAPFHALRIAGMIMLCFSTCMTCYIVRLAKRRRMEQEWDADFKRRGKGGLVTEEGVDYMLHVGRTQSMVMTMSSPDTQDNLPTPTNTQATTPTNTTTTLVHDASLSMPFSGHMNLDPPNAMLTQTIDTRLKNT